MPHTRVYCKPNLQLVEGGREVWPRKGRFQNTGDSLDRCGAFMVQLRRAEAFLFLFLEVLDLLLQSSETLFDDFIFRLYRRVFIRQDLVLDG